MFLQAGSKSAMWEKIKQLAEKEAETPGFCCFWYPKHFNSWVISYTLYILTVISSFYLNELELNFCYLQHRVLTNNESGIRLKSLTLPTGEEGLRTQALEPDCLGSSPGSFHLLVIYNLCFDVTICKRRITVPTNRDGLNVTWVSTLKPLEQSLTHSNHLTGVSDYCSHCSITTPSVGNLMLCFADVPTVTRHLAPHIPYYMTQGESREGPSQAGTGEKAMRVIHSFRHHTLFSLKKLSHNQTPNLPPLHFQSHCSSFCSAGFLNLNLLRFLDSTDDFSLAKKIK